MLLHVSILRSSSGSTHFSLLKLHVKIVNTSLYLSVINIITYKYKGVFTILTCNFSKEQYVLPEDDLRVETCRSILSVLI